MSIIARLYFMGRQAERDKRARRSNFEFSNQVKTDIEARSGGICEVCKQQKASQFHHIIAIAVAIMNNFDSKQINNVSNGQHVCPECHQKVD